MTSKATENKSNEGDKASFYDDEANLKKLCNFLRSSEGPPVREAVQMDQRVYYLKGTFLLRLSFLIVWHHNWKINLSTFYF
jgi:hypothetical protein